MSPGLDSGPILLQREFFLTSEKYIGDVYRFMTQNIPEMFVQVLEGLASGTIVFKEQPDNPALWLRCLPRLPQDGEIDWRQSAVDLSRLVRANAEPFSGAYSFWGTEKLIIWRAHPEPLPYNYLGYPGQVIEINKSQGCVSVMSGKGNLVLEEVEMGLRRRGPASHFINSTRVRLGLNLSQTLIDLNQRIFQMEENLKQFTERFGSRKVHSRRKRS
jgi:methionyl-tRNA formyltransferase